VNPVLGYAEKYRKLGFSTIPIKPDGSKQPPLKWREYQNDPACPETLQRWFDDGSAMGIAVVCGEVSGNLEILDVDRPDLRQPFEQQLEEIAPNLLAKLTQVQTPRDEDARHYWYRCSDLISGSQKLTVNETGKDTWIETKAEGGYVLAPGSPGSCHKTGRTYRYFGGPKFSQISVLSPEEVETIHAVARSFDKRPPEQTQPSSSGRKTTGENRPGDDFNQRAEWAEILEPHGWVAEKQSGDLAYWRRPGKSNGHSATTGLISEDGNELLCVFSQNAAPFNGAKNGQACSTYTKFGAYALLNYKGDFSRATAKLVELGYGGGQEKQPENPIPPWRPFPVDALPALVSTYVERCAAAIGCDPAFVAVPILPTLGAALGNTRRVRLRNSWYEPPVIWAGLVADSGAQKSPAIDAATKHIGELQAQAFHEYRLRMEQFEREQETYKIACDEWKRAGRKKGEAPPEKPDRPVCTRYVCSDVTVEALAEILVQTGRGTLVTRDELSGWLLGMNQYKGGRGADEAHWLAMHGARDLLIDRKTGNGPIFAARAAVSICGAITPDVLRRALGREHFENGLAPRLLLAMPPRRKKRWTENDIDNKTDRHMADIISRLYSLESQTADNGQQQPVTVPMSGEAKSRWVDWYNLHGERQRDAVGDVAAVLSKLEATCARLALIFQMARAAAGDASYVEIDRQSVESAITVTDWFVVEIPRVYQVLRAGSDGDEQRRLVEWIEGRGGRVTPRNLSRHLRDYAGTDEAEEALERLHKSGLGDWETTRTGKRGPATREFVLHRAVAATRSDETPEITKPVGADNQGKSREAEQEQNEEDSEDDQPAGCKTSPKPMLQPTGFVESGTKTKPVGDDNQRDLKEHYCEQANGNRNGDLVSGPTTSLEPPTSFAESREAKKLVDSTPGFWSGQLLAGTLAIDTETTLIEDGEVPDLALASVSDGEQHFIVEPSRLGEFILAHRDGHFVCHNAAFDFWVINRYLLDVNECQAIDAWWAAADDGRLHDTMFLDMLVRLTQSDEHPRPRDLVTVAEQYAGLRLDKDDPFRKRYGEIIGEDLATVDAGFLRYAIEDAVATISAFKHLQAVAERIAQPYDDQILPDARGRFGLLTETIQVRAAIALSSTSRNGMCLDPEQIEETRGRLQHRMERMVAELEQLGTVADGSDTGEDPGQLTNIFQRTKTGRMKFTPSGVPSISKDRLEAKLQEIVAAADVDIEMPRTAKTKKLSTSAKYWAQYRHLHPFIDRWVELTEISKLLQFCGKMVGERVRPHYTVLVRTGRTSCSKPNIQQLPRADGFREMIIPSPGHYLFAIDYSAIELRTLAAVCLHRYGESKLAEVIREGIDPHCYTAALFEGMTLDEFVVLKHEDSARFKTLRQRAKAINFGLPGGLGPATLVTYAQQTYDVELTLGEARLFRAKLIGEVYPELSRYLRDNADAPTNVVTLTGRVRGGVTFCQAHNTPFQGLAADGAKLALWKLLKARYRLVGFVHDEVLIELPIDADHTAEAERIDGIMCSTMQELTGAVPIACEYALSSMWSKQAEAVFTEDGKLIPWET
jgi:acyl-CoA-binding protein